MRYLKSYKLFESVITETEFPTKLDIQEIIDFLKQNQEVDIMKYQLERIKVIKSK